MQIGQGNRVSGMRLGIFQKQLKNGKKQSFCTATVRVFCQILAGKEYPFGRKKTDVRCARAIDPRRFATQSRVRIPRSKLRLGALFRGKTALRFFKKAAKARRRKN